MYLVMGPGTELLKLLELSGKGIFCYVNEVTFGKHLRMGAGCQ